MSQGHFAEERDPYKLRQAPDVDSSPRSLLGSASRRRKLCRVGVGSSQLAIVSWALRAPNTDAEALFLFISPSPLWREVDEGGTARIT